MACGSPMVRAQDEMIVYDEAIDNRIRGIGNEGTLLFADDSPDAIISDKTATLRRASSQAPGRYGSDARASEAARMLDLGSKAAKELADEKASYTEPAAFEFYPGQPAPFIGHPFPLLEK
eukprot:13985554-Heterocapsa_arctica.AAC.1